MIFKDTERILVIKLRHIGDVLLSVPVFRALREGFPSAHIAALINSGTEDVLADNPLIDEIIVFDRGIKKMNPLNKYKKELFFLKSIRGKGFDMTVDLTGGDRAAILSFVSGARYRLGWEPEKGFIGKKYLYTHLSRPDGRKHMVLQNLDVTGQYGISTDNHSVDFHIPEKDRTHVRKILEQNNVTGDHTIVHVHPTSRWLFKCWKDEYMAEIIGWLIDQGVKVVVTSSPDTKEIEKGKKILSFVPSRTTHHTSGVIDLCGKTTIKQLAAISEISALFFGVDSAPMHIAAAVGTPVIALFGPSGAFSWGPWDNGSSKLKVKSSKFENTNNETSTFKRNSVQSFGSHTVIQRDWDCVPCGKDGCEGTKISRCLVEITPAEVKDVLTRKLRDIKK